MNTIQQNTMANSMQSSLGSMQQGNIPPGIMNAANLNMNIGNIAQQPGNVNIPPSTMVGAMNQIGNINMAMNMNNANQTVAQNQMNASNINQQLNAGQQINPQMSQILNRMNQQNAPNMANQLNQNQQMVNQLNAGGPTTSEFKIVKKSTECKTKMFI